MRLIGWFLVLVLGGAAALTLDPELPGRVSAGRAGLTMTYPISQVVALRPLTIAALGIVALVLLVVGVVRKITMRMGNHALVLGLILLVVAGAHVWVLSERGLSSTDGLPPDDGVRAAGQGTGAITVLSYNTGGGRTSAEEVAALADENGVDVLALTETGREAADAVAALLADAGHADFQVFTDSRGEEGVGATALLVADTLGEYAQTAAPQTRFGAVRAEPATGVGPVFLAVHPTPPLADRTDAWTEDLEAVTEVCRSGEPGLVLAGDLNATLDHAPMRDLGSCRSAAVAGGIGAVSTWPTTIPRWLGAPIDHVLVGDGHEVVAAAVVERGSSDHRALLVRLLPAG
ncbi:endonuclease/exonuclease/phosphatase family protein [Georgenia sp.]